MCTDRYNEYYIIRVRIKALITILGAVAFTLTGCSRYSAEPIEGWVIDADTKKPIEGVINDWLRFTQVQKFFC